jgi:hypothetical protein
MKRVPYSAIQGGIGLLRGGHWRGSAEVDTRPYVVYQPGCQPITIPGVSYNYSRGQCGRFYQPGTIRRSYPAREHHESPCHAQQACCHPCQRGLPCECGGSCRGGGVGKSRGGAVPARQSERFKQYAARFAAQRGIGGGLGGCGGGCNPELGPNWALGGCAPGSRPYGLNWGYQRHHTRWPVERRVVPFPVAQQPYYVGYAVPTYNEPFAGCATRQAPYWVEDPCRPGIGYAKGTHLRATSTTVGSWRSGMGRRGLTKTPKRLGSARGLTLRPSAAGSCDKCPRGYHCVCNNPNCNPPGVTCRPGPHRGHWLTPG